MERNEREETSKHHGCHTGSRKHEGVDCRAPGLHLMQLI